VNSLEPEFQELNAAGLIDDATTSRAVALDNSTILSVF